MTLEDYRKLMRPEQVRRFSYCGTYPCPHCGRPDVWHDMGGTPGGSDFGWEALLCRSCDVWLEPACQCASEWCRLRPERPSQFDWPITEDVYEVTDGEVTYVGPS
jgi:hypothetical protein